MFSYCRVFNRGNYGVYLLTEFSFARIVPYTHIVAGSAAGDAEVREPTVGTGLGPGLIRLDLYACSSRWWCDEQTLWGWVYVLTAAFRALPAYRGGVGVFR